MAKALLPVLAALAASAVLLAACDSPPAPPPAVRGAVSAAPTPRESQPPRRAEGALALERLGIAVRPGLHGATIIAMDLDGPAAHAGAQVGDVLLGVNGTAVTTADELERLATTGGRLVLDVQRGAERRQVAVAGASAAPHGTWNALGLQVREVPPDTLKSLGVGYGIMVTKVRAPADRTRILPGDVIVGVNYTSLRSMDQFNRLVAEANRAIALLVRRADSDLYIAFDMGGVPRGGDASRGGGLPPVETFKTNRDATGRPLRT